MAQSSNDAQAEAAAGSEVVPMEVDQVALVPLAAESFQCIQCKRMAEKGTVTHKAANGLVKKRCNECNATNARVSRISDPNLRKSYWEMDTESKVSLYTRTFVMQLLQAWGS